MNSREISSFQDGVELCLAKITEAKTLEDARDKVQSILGHILEKKFDLLIGKYIEKK